MYVPERSSLIAATCFAKRWVPRIRSAAGCAGLLLCGLGCEMALASKAFLTLDAAAGVRLALLAAEEGVPEALALLHQRRALFGGLATLREATVGRQRMDSDLGLHREGRRRHSDIRCTYGVMHVMSVAFAVRDSTDNISYSVRTFTQSLSIKHCTNCSSRPLHELDILMWAAPETRRPAKTACKVVIPRRCLSQA